MTPRLLITYRVLFLAVFLLPSVELVSYQKLYPTGDWLISYEEGFVRRGLVGNLAYQLSSITGVPRIWALFLIIIPLYALLVYFVYKLAVSAGGSPVVLALVFSPAFLIGQISESNGFRKEILFFLILAQLLYFSRFSGMPKNIAIVLASLGMPFAVLAHEGLVFTVPFLIYAFFLLWNEGVYKAWHVLLAGAVSAIGSGLAFFLAASHRGSMDMALAMCSNLMADGLPRKVCRSVVPLGDNFQDAVLANAEVFRNENYVAVYFVSLVLAALPFAGVRFSRIALIGVALSSVALGPLFVLGIDWGRWILIGSVSVSMITLRFLGGANFSRRPNFTGSVAGPLFFLLLAFYSLSWSIPTHSLDRLGDGIIGWLLALFDPIWVKSIWPVLLQLKDVVAFLA